MATRTVPLNNLAKRGRNPFGSSSAPSYTPVFSGNPFDSLAEGNPAGNFDTRNDPILPSPVWNEAVEGAMKRQRGRKQNRR